MHKKIVAMIIVAGMTLGTINNSVFANPAKNSVSSNLQQVNNSNIENNKSEYEKAIKEVEEIEIKIEKLDSKIQDMIVKIDQANNSIELTNEKMDKSQKEIEKAKSEISEEQKIFGKRAKNLYMNGTDSYLEVILDAKGFHDFIARIEDLRSIVKLDKEVMAKLRDKQEIIELNQKKLEEDKKNLILLKSTIEKDLTEVKNSKDLQEPLIKEANNKKDMYAGIISKYQAQLEENRKKAEEENRLKEVAKNKSSSNSTTTSIQAQKEDSSSSSKHGVVKLTSNKINSSKTTTSKNDSVKNTITVKPKPQSKPKPSKVENDVPSSGGLGERAVAEALKYQGIKYVWGGETPSGFDCSGLMQYVYRRLGVEIGRSTYDQIDSGYYVEKSQLRPGDLVFFGSASAPHHVGMYIGGGQYIHAPRTRDVVKISSLGYRGDYCGARRIGN